MSAPTGRRERPPYPLALEPDGRSWTARENLTDVLERELLGPAGGPNEVLSAPPDVAYLLGRIAPFKLIDGQGELAADGDDGAAADVGDARDAEDGRGVPVATVDESGAESDPDTESIDDQPQHRGLMVPASMGLRFQVPADLAAVTVTASWGVYQPVRDEDPEGGARRATRYERTPVEIEAEVRIDDLVPGSTSTVPLIDDVVLRLDRHDDPDRGYRIVEVALCNDRVTPRQIPVNAWLFQARLHVEAGGSWAFVPVADVLTDPSLAEERDDELRRLALQYRDRLEFAIGRTCSVDWTELPGERRASAVWTTWLPISETPPTAAEEVDGAMLDMTRLADADRDQIVSGLEPIVARYESWLGGQGDRIAQLPEHLRAEATDAVDEARQVAAQLRAGLEHLADPANDESLRCFRFMNAVMAEQRVRTQVAAYRAEHPKSSIAEARAAVLGDRPWRAHSWRTFQLAFVVMQLPALTDPAAPRRSGADPFAKAQLLFFPTGGGKTEAYLGLAAYTFAIRRRQGVLETADGPLDGRFGVAVLMRYTLRLLTAQQFQRATALVCAAEIERSKDPTVWGEEPFRVGLWVGTDVSPKRYGEAEDQLRKANQGRGHRLTVLQLRRCPWCGAPIGARDIQPNRTEQRIRVYCSNGLGGCPFARGASPEGLPVLTVDEEIYRLVPAFVIATVDKFARLAREGQAASLFGHVRLRCDRHGFVHPDDGECTIQDGGKHPVAKDGAPAAAKRRANRLRPPDLIIQDELHLITGALGTTVGLFESAVDVLSSWRDRAGTPVQPLLVASTATARNAPDQIRALYGRSVTIFPPQVLDAGDTFFSRELTVTDTAPGRRYVGISTTGIRLTTAEIRVAEVLMAGGQLLLDRHDAAADPYMTLVGYFSATRELAGMTRYLGDDVQTNLAKRRPWSLLPARTGTDFGSLHRAELTARVSNADITATLDEMTVGFDPARDSTTGKRDLAERRAKGEKIPDRETNPFDAVLATSMLQVGVDVTRLGLMLVVGQPKNTAEYIQASSRVGRDADRPGLVVALGNWARPRDLAHFEHFRHYHETFYRRVEALSVTPFSATSMDRGLDGVLVSAARVRDAVRTDGLSPERAAGRVDTERAALEELVDQIVDRVERAGGEDAATVARSRLLNRLDQWSKRRAHLHQLNKDLVYERVPDTTHAGPLLTSPEHVRANSGKDAAPFVVANSMREVQPEINLLVSPIEENLYVVEPPGTPGWTFAHSGEESS